MSYHREYIRNVAVFSLAAVLAGWAGHWLDTAVSGPSVEGIGQLLWIVLPVTTGALLRLLAGDGWRDAGVRPLFSGNGRWYLFSSLFFPLMALLSMLAGAASGAAVFSFPGAGAMLQAVMAALLPSFIKNIFEEFAWRGYLTPRLAAAGMPDFANHTCTGVVWAAWHVPYYLYFLDGATMSAYSQHGPAVFYPMMFAGVAALAFLYGELRLLTGSVWPMVVLHTVSNAVGGALLLNGWLRMGPVADLMVSPAPGSLLSILLNIAIGLGLHRYRKSRDSA